MTIDSSSEPTSAFDQANELWFWEGRSHEALRLYEQAARGAPEDAAVQFQWARAQAALGRGAAALATVENVLSRATRLGADASAQLEALRRQLASGGVQAQLPAGIQPDDLDVERLGERRLSSADWHALAHAAEQLGAYGVAMFGRQHAKGAITVIDEEKEDWELIKKAESELTLLDLLAAAKG